MSASLSISNVPVLRPQIDGLKGWDPHEQDQWPYERNPKGSLDPLSHKNTTSVCSIQQEAGPHQINIKYDSILILDFLGPRTMRNKLLFI